MITDNLINPKIAPNLGKVWCFLKQKLCFDSKTSGSAGNGAAFFETALRDGRCGHVMV